MTTVPVKNAPLLAGWLIAFGVAAVAFGVCIVVAKLGFSGSAFIALVLFGVVGLILGLPGKDGLGDAMAPAVVAPAVSAVAEPAPIITATVKPTTILPPPVPPAVERSPFADPVPVAAPLADAPPNAPLPAAAARKIAKKSPGPVGLETESRAAGAAQLAAPVAGTDGASAVLQKPKALKAARKGKADDLKQIKGIGPKLEVLCNSLGFYHFDQIAAWTEAEVAWVDQNLEGFRGRVSRDTWVAQAKILSAGGATEFAARVKDGEVY